MAKCFQLLKFHNLTCWASGANCKIPGKPQGSNKQDVHTKTCDTSLGSIILYYFPFITNCISPSFQNQQKVVLFELSLSALQHQVTIIFQDTLQLFFCRESSFLFKLLLRQWCCLFRPSSSICSARFPYKSQKKEGKDNT